MTLKEQLRAALDLLGPNGENWTRDESEIVHTKTKQCALSASYVVAKTDKGSYGAMRAALAEQLPDPSTGVTSFNDTHTFPEVKALFERAIAAAE